MILRRLHAFLFRTDEHCAVLPPQKKTMLTDSGRRVSPWQVEIFPDGTQRVTVHRIKKRRYGRQRGKSAKFNPSKTDLSSAIPPSYRDHAHRADVLARQAGVAAGESEELVGNY